MTKPLIITVDDDLDVLQIFERDLRQEYGNDFRILGANSGTKALEILKKLKLRNDSVALFLVDQRMPQLTGVEFLEEAMRMFPDAKRILLTAYANTDAAIDAINKAKVDHYLLKPWNPPQENLYPVINDLLEMWQVSFHPPFEGVCVIDYRWSSGGHQVKDFLTRNQIAYQWLDVEKNEQARHLVSYANSEFSQLPLLLFPDGSHLTKPSNVQIAKKVGLKMQAQMPFYDLVIVGAGPAGLAAAVYAASEGLRTVLIEREAPGGQAGTSSRIENYLGFPLGLSGADLAKRSVAQAYKFGVEILAPQTVTNIRVEGSYRIVTLGDNTEISCHALIVATGVSYNKLGIPGCEKLTGAGIYYGAAMTEALSCQGDNVCIVGGANSAGQAAMHLSKYARNVTILVRGDSLAKRMSKYLIDRIVETGNIKIKISTQVVEVLGKDKLETIILSDLETGKIESIDSNALFVFIGAKPNTCWLQEIVERDQDGFILTGSDLMRGNTQSKRWRLEREPFMLETSVPGIFAVGDVRYQSVKRVASAVGEGSVAVQFVHRYLSSF